MNLSRMRLRCSLALATMVWLLFPGLVLAEELVVPETTQPAHPPTLTDTPKADPTPAVIHSKCPLLPWTGGCIFWRQTARMS